jgi:hypothetical protein
MWDCIVSNGDCGFRTVKSVRKIHVKIWKKTENEIEEVGEDGNLYFCELLGFLRVFTISFSICSISLFF